jgi:hypothetical protein
VTHPRPSRPKRRKGRTPTGARWGSVQCRPSASQLAHWDKEGCEPLIIERLVKRFLNLGPPEMAVVAKGMESFNREARVLDAEAILPGRDRGHARGLLGRGAAVLRQGSGSAGRALSTPVGLVCSRVGAARLARHRAGTGLRRGLRVVQSRPGAPCNPTQGWPRTPQREYRELVFMGSRWRRKHSRAADRSRNISLAGKQDMIPGASLRRSPGR